MDSTANSSTINEHPLSNEVETRKPSDAGESFQSATEVFPPKDEDAMDTRHDNTAEAESQNGSKTALDPTKASSAVSSSISLDSRTSTLKYTQEPFDQYQVRVRELCHSLWPSQSQATSAQRRPTGIKRSRFFSAVRVKRSRRAPLPLPSPQNEFIIERMNGGTYNRITGITVKEPGVKDLKKVILRVPRPQMAFFGYIEREVAILRYVREKTTLPVADIVSFDPTTNNPLGSGYVVQSRLSGVSLHAIWDDLTHEQRCTIAQDVGQIILVLQSVTNPVPGIVEAFPANDGAQKFSVRPFDIKSPYDDGWKAKIPPHVPDEGNNAAVPSAEEWFGTQFGRWLAHELLENPAQILYWDYQYQFVQVTKQMDSLGILGDGTNCLCHFDLAARNIMVQTLPNGSVTVSGIVDWDSAVFAPKLASCAPPSWLWTDQKHYDAEEGPASFEPNTPEQEEIKAAFDDVVGFDWAWLAYKPEYRLARELFYFARHGLQDQEAQQKAVRFLKEWEVMYDSLMSPSKDDASIEDAASRNSSKEDEATEGDGPDEEDKGELETAQIS